MCGTRWACASDVAIREAMAALYHALGTSRILEGLRLLRGSVEPGKGLVVGVARLEVQEGEYWTDVRSG